MRFDVEVLKGALVAAAGGILVSLVLGFLLAVVFTSKLPESDVGPVVAYFLPRDVRDVADDRGICGPGVFRARSDLLQHPQRGSAGRRAGACVHAGLLSPG